MNREPSVRVEVTGTWDLEVTLRNCTTGKRVQTLHSVATFAVGGALMETSAETAPGPDAPGHGMWRHLGGNCYAGVLSFYRFSRDGRVTESRKVIRRLNLDDEGRRFTGTARVEVFDSCDRLVQCLCATECATRIE